ncbi:molybdopterin dehydrogenase, FAD-binding protein [Rhodopirellula maiorica SM1]|uniref:Molybdopterin dehydrogenase, FAD-binding protein n=1 Tax=Rhodopirellula maiorica SM1 TaxID=1265738 RepID=M5RHB6_9BACT|nr:xanthine dehydrogenase family protein subunit M [Rhodopirellula maiorica]EMI18758.1 molybdopterin dehydrogenase, FAD-binding protein [Rhodopirellula maiorica SM1]
MIPFQFERPGSLQEAGRQLQADGTMPLGGGTTLLDLMKLNVLKPSRLSFVKPLLDDSVSVKESTLVVGAGCTMSQLADDDSVKDSFPAIRQSLILAASPQIRNMATLGGNLLQRTRCTYFRHPDMPLNPEGDAELKLDTSGVETSMMAVLGNEGRLVGVYPGDFAVTFVAFAGQLSLSGPEGDRTIDARSFYRVPNQNEFQYSTELKRGEIITSIQLPVSKTLRNSLYLKVRERSSYAFALASASVGIELDGSGSSATIRSANVGLGGLGSIPWHSPEAEAALIDRPATDKTFEQAADAALADANPPQGTEYKVTLAKRTLVRALKILRDHGPLNDQELWAMQHGRGVQ